MYDNAKLDSMLNLKGYDEKAYFFMLDGDQNITYTNQSDDKFREHPKVCVNLQTDVR